MSYLGSWEIDDLVTFAANTHGTDGVAADADAAPSYRVYEDETATPILTGTMALLDSANTTGLYTEQITLSAANGFEVGKSYTIYIEATVSSNVGTMSHTLRVEQDVWEKVFGLPPQGAPPTAPTAQQVLEHFYEAYRNKLDQTDTGDFRIYADGGATVQRKTTVTDDGSVTTKGEIVSGP